jgi:hypothetical protein
MVVVIDRWSLFGGGRWLRFDCKNVIRSFYLLIVSSFGKKSCLWHDVPNSWLHFLWSTQFHLLISVATTSARVNVNSFF